MNISTRAHTNEEEEREREREREREIRAYLMILRREEVLVILLWQETCPSYLFEMPKKKTDISETICRYYCFLVFLL